MSILKRIKQSINDYMNKMEKANNELFGGKTPDCCTLNRKNNMDKR